MRLGTRQKIAADLAIEAELRRWGRRRRPPSMPRQMAELWLQCRASASRSASSCMMMGRVSMVTFGAEGRPYCGVVTIRSKW